MRDVVFEWCVPYILSRKQQLVKAVMVSAAIVFLIDAIFFAAIMLFASLALMIAGFFLFRSWKIEYEYEYVNGDLTISKIIRKSKRKELYHTTRVEIEDITKGRQNANGRKVNDYTSNRPKAPVYTLRVKGELVYVEACDAFVDEMKKYYRL